MARVSDARLSLLDVLHIRRPGTLDLSTRGGVLGRFCDMAGLDNLHNRGDWTHSMDFGYDDEIPQIADAIGRRPLDEWSRLLDEAEIPFAPILTLEEAVKSDHAAASRLLRGTELPDGRVQVAASPVQISSDPDEAVSSDLPDLPPPPDLGYHSDEVLQAVGLERLVGKDLSS